MTRSEIFREIQNVPNPEQFDLLETLARLLRQQCPVSREDFSVRRPLAQAAEALRAEYQNDPELTAFTALDGEEFHVAH